jgi:hypothetical protein
MVDCYNYIKEVVIMFDYLYEWILTDIIGNSVYMASMTEPFTLLLTYIAMFMVLWALVYLVKWTIKFVSVLFPW